MSEGSICNFGSQIPDAYIFCVSKKIREKYGDSHYRIADHKTFGEMIFASLKRADPLVYCMHFNRVVYGGPKDFQVRYASDLSKLLKDYNLSEANILDYYLKPAKYNDDQEYRNVFLTSNPDVKEFIDIECDLETINACCAFP